MRSDFDLFEFITRQSYKFNAGRQETALENIHPFEARNIHSALPAVVRQLFDDGHYSQSTFEAFKFVDREVVRHSGSTESGFKLMMQVFPEVSPLIQLTALRNTSERDEQKGYQFLFAGSVLAIRNPRGHDILTDDPDTCLDHLTIASHLLRRLNEAGYR